MSGHSKWATIKRQKGAADTKRAQVFTKLSNAITIAVRQGGGVADPESNPRLRLAVDAARNANMPKDNIDRAISRALGNKDNEMTEITYEGFGPGGFSIIIEAITDNKQRTTPEIKSRMEKLGGNMGTPGSVAYQFEQKGLINISKGQNSQDEIFLIAADAGAEDLEEAGEDILIYTKPEELNKVREALMTTGLKIKSAELVRKPLTYVQLNTVDTAQKALQFTERLEELDDIQKIYANYDIPDEIGKQLI